MFVDPYHIVIQMKLTLSQLRHLWWFQFANNFCSRWLIQRYFSVAGVKGWISVLCHMAHKTVRQTTTWSKSSLRIMICKAKRQYLLTCKVSRYCLFALRGSVINRYHGYWSVLVAWTRKRLISQTLLSTIIYVHGLKTLTLYLLVARKSVIGPILTLLARGPSLYVKIWRL